MAKKPDDREQIAPKRSRGARAKSMSVKARSELVNKLIDGALKGASDDDRSKIAEQLVNRALVIMGEIHETDQIHVLYPTAPTTRILTAIGKHMDATGEDGETVIERVLTCLNQQAADASRPN